VKTAEDWVRRVVERSARRPYAVLAAALVLLAATWAYAARLELHTDLLELLPRDSPGFRAFEHNLGRTGGRASLLVIVESSDPAANERFVDDLAAKVRESFGPDLVLYVESGEKEVRAFYEGNKWLYADLRDLTEAEETLDHQIAFRSGLVADLEGETTGSPPPTALGLDAYRARWESRVRERDDSKTGYFETKDRTMAGLRLVSKLSGMGDRGGDALLARVRSLVLTLGPAAYAPGARVGFAGDIANSVEEKDSLLSNAVWATACALLLVCVGIVVFFRSLWSIPIVVLPALIGVGCAYALAMARFGYVNSTGAFLGAIIVGNGINYPIVLLSRYREFRELGSPPDVARRDAVASALRAELVGAAVGSVAYGSLVLTRFRGFSQFGWIGLFGMLLVWLSMIPVVPALVVIVERLGGLGVQPRGVTRAPLMRHIARLTEARPWTVLAIAAGLTTLSLWKLPAFVRDPWEYNFDRLGSRGTKLGGAGEWSSKADGVFGGKMNVAGALMLADSPEQVPLLKRQILANDALDPEGGVIADITTLYDLLPGSPAEQRAKLQVLGRIRDRLTPRVLAGLAEDERARVQEARPPETLRVLTATDLPETYKRRFEENDGRLGTAFYVRYKNDLSLSDGHVLLRIARTTDNVNLPDGTVVATASRATIFAEMIRSMQRDGPLATAASLCAVMLVVVLATANARGAMVVLGALLVGGTWMIGVAEWTDTKLNFLNFIVLPITFAIGCEYPFNVYDRSRILRGDAGLALRRAGGAVALCSYTTVVGYGSLLWSDFQSLQSFGGLAMAGEVACLLSALLVVPSLLFVSGAAERAGAYRDEERAA
jgi:predicted RND superfamily exporter protein